MDLEDPALFVFPLEELKVATALMQKQACFLKGRFLEVGEIESLKRKRGRYRLWEGKNR